ncbi:MAG: hypothetical protein QW478_07205 [Candidatus Micrarchaeaceae archaeon]
MSDIEYIGGEELEIYKLVRKFARETVAKELKTDPLTEDVMRRIDTFVGHIINILIDYAGYEPDFDIIADTSVE